MMIQVFIATRTISPKPVAKLFGVFEHDSPPKKLKHIQVRRPGISSSSVACQADCRKNSEGTARGRALHTTWCFRVNCSESARVRLGECGPRTPPGRLSARRLHRGFSLRLGRGSLFHWQLAARAAAARPGRRRAGDQPGPLADCRRLAVVAASSAFRSLVPTKKLKTFFGHSP